MSDKGFERSDKMSVDYVGDARGMSEIILAKSYRGAGDTVEAAMHRAERKFGAPATWMHRLRYRNIKDMPVSAYAAIVNAYKLATEAADRAYEVERIAHAPNSKILRAADFIAGTKSTGGSTEVSRLLAAPNEATTTPE